MIKVAESARRPLREVKHSDVIPWRSEWKARWRAADPNRIANSSATATRSRRLAEGADAQSLLQRLIAAGATVSKFELVEPSLNDIFIAKVGETE